jgi:predicted PolB exonuclease-like 3'-5' exonuclease
VWLIFDIESVPDGLLLAQVKYAYKDMNPEKAIALARKQAVDTTGRDFVPYSYQYPVAICYGLVDSSYKLLELGHFGTYPDPHGPGAYVRSIVHEFWKLVADKKPRFVTFNGRGFDIPLLELMAFKYGIQIPEHYKDKYGARYRFGDSHIDLQEFLTNYGASRLAGGLELASKLLGRSGKMGIHGDQVYDMYKSGRTSEIISYCLSDVVETYHVFLRTRVLLGAIDIATERRLIEDDAAGTMCAQR